MYDILMRWLYGREAAHPAAYGGTRLDDVSAGKGGQYFLVNAPKHLQTEQWPFHLYFGMHLQGLWHDPAPVFDVDNQMGLTDEQRQLIQQWSKLNDRSKRLVSELVDALNEKA